MYAHIRGIIDAKTADAIIVDVGGIGFRAMASLSTLSAAGQAGDVIKLYTHTYVREDTLALYGFISHEERHVFEQLLSVSGVGPKAALAVLSAMSPSQFGLAVLTEDADILTKAQGIGKKTALRLILELKDRLKKETGNHLPVSIGASGAKVENNVLQDAASALMMLGYTQLEAQTAIKQVFTEEKSLEQLIRDALKMMAIR